MAEVFLAKKRGAEGTSKVVVLKRILPGFTASRRFRAMFIDEAQLATRLNHPNVVQVYEFSNEGDDGHILAMEYVEGCDLGKLMGAAKSKGIRLPPWVSAWIVAEVAKGLHYAHEKRDEEGEPLDIVHRDVSPQNILLSFEGVVKIADFGIASARLTGDERTVLKGKFGYMSPEQARGEKVDRRSDLYSLGVILWECLTGRPLHEGLAGESLLDIVRAGVIEAPSAHVRDIPDELESIVLKLLAPHPSDRFATSRDVAAAIARAALLEQVLVDGASLEAILGELVPRLPGEGESSPASHQGKGDGNYTQAAAPRALDGTFGSSKSVRQTAGASSSRRPEAREVRHIAIVTLRLLESVTTNEAERRSLARALERSRHMLGDMAYKRGTRWVWMSDFEARAIAGLGVKPAKAASDAAWLAVETHEAMAAVVDDLPVRIGVSLSIVRGIASGSRDPEGNLVRYVLHDPVSYLADVLARATPAGATWVAGGVYRLVRRDFRWGDAPTLDTLDTAGAMQDLPRAVRVYALERSLTREEKAQEQANAQSDLVGRDAEKAELHAAFHAAIHGPNGGQVTGRAVVGELGIGKTALVATFLSELAQISRVVRAECTPVRTEVPYSMLADLVRDAVGATSDTSFSEMAQLIACAGSAADDDEANPAVVRLAEIASSDPRGRDAPMDDEDAHYRKMLLVKGFRHLFTVLALDRPLVVVIDGLEWIDRPSLELIDDVLCKPDSLPILFVLVTRPTDRIAHTLEGKVRIELHGLSSEEQIRLVETRLSVKEGVREVCAELMPRAGGNPFYLLEMIDALLERGALEIREDRLERPLDVDLDAMGLPSTLKQLLADRIQELPGPEHVVVDWLAIAGGPLGLGDLAKLGAQTNGADADRSLLVGEDAIAGLIERGLCDRKGDALDFRHPLTRDVAYAALDATTRVRMHRALGEHLAETLLARGVSAAIIARHLVRGEAPERAAHFYLEAADAARSAYQTKLAIRYYLRAAQYLLPDDPRRLSVHAALETTYRVLGRRRERVRHLEILRATAKATGSPRAACLALLRTARFDLDEGRLSRGLSVAKQAAQLARIASYPNFEIEAELLVSELSSELGEVHGALVASDRAVAACNPKINPGVPARVRANMLRIRGILLRRVGRVREATSAYAEAIAIFRRTQSRRAEARTKNALAYSMFVEGRYEDAIALALESIRIDLSVGGRIQLTRTLTNIGHSYASLGDGARAMAYLARAREVHARYREQDGRADTAFVTAEVLLDLGETEEADKFVREGMDIAHTTGNAYDVAHGMTVIAALAHARGNAPETIRNAALARASAERQALVAYHFYALALEAAARTDVGDLHAATLLATTALGAVEALQGCEYGLQIRILCANALMRAGSPVATAARQRVVDYITALLRTIRDPRYRRSFLERSLVAALFDDTPTHHAAGDRAS